MSAPEKNNEETNENKNQSTLEPAQEDNTEANEYRNNLDKVQRDNPADTTVYDNDNYDVASVYTLKGELSQYIDRSESSLYHEYYPGIESVQYNYILERQNPYSTNFLESMSHLIKSCLGAGILGMHEGFMYAGIWTSLVTVFILGLFIPYSMLMLVTCAQKMYVKIRVPKLTYADLAEAAIATGPLKPCRRLSKTFRYIVDFCLFLQLCGTCCIYEIMIADTLKQVIETASKQNFSLRIYIVISMIPLLVLTLIRSLKYLAPFALVADLFVAVCIITTMYYSIAVASDIRDRPAWKNFHGLIEFCGVCIYSMDGIPIVLAVENNMNTPQYIKHVILYGMTIVVIAVTITGFFGYWAWGESCRTPITTHMPMEMLPIILRFLLVGMLAVTFAVQFWVPFRTVWHYIGKNCLRKRACWERFYRLLQVVAITAVALIFPNMIKLMIFMGDFFLAFITFIFPALININVTWNEHKPRTIRWSCIKDVAIILFGVVLCVGSLYSLFD
ncbi:proton-coupled amino acid transporter-like protein pathetic [Galleria mellonella]|uniref:Proton-coupled amino acid transporter-like protein pathetic n=1 Tax=Galleria mellonella TaxID=7137 RepID=A0ABM3M9L8_GALME|nr:proton-coupled amino acid transporter-like protein pathetic [Galleria mellonella]